MKKLRIALSVVGALFLFTSAAQAAVQPVGTAVASEAGAGAIDFSVDSSADPAAIADQIRANLSLSNGARIQSISVANGVAHVEFAGAVAGSTVEATLPSDIASAIGFGATGLAGSGLGTGAVVGGGAALVTGGVLGGLAGSGQFDGGGGVQTGAE